MQVINPELIQGKKVLLRLDLDVSIEDGEVVENLRFEKGEDEADVYYAKELASLGNFYVNEAFASHHNAASTTILPMLLPYAAGLQFVKEVEMLKRVIEAPKAPRLPDQVW